MDSIRIFRASFLNTESASVAAIVDGLFAHKQPSANKKLSTDFGAKNVGAAQEARIASRKQTSLLVGGVPSESLTFIIGSKNVNFTLW